MSGHFIFGKGVVVVVRFVVVVVVKTGLVEFLENRVVVLDVDLVVDVDTVVVGLCWLVRVKFGR